MTDYRRLDVSEIDFDQIKENLKTFLQSQDQFQDYNYEGSALSALLDVMSYVTHYNAVNANMALNETFLDTAQLRPSVVSHAKLLGYTPRSAYAPVAYVNVKVNNPTGMQGDDDQWLPMTMEIGTQFSTLVDGKTYTFVNDETITTTTRDSSNNYIFENVKLLQGRYTTIEYYYTVDANEEFVVHHEDVVTDTLQVDVYQSRASSSYETYSRFDNVVSVDSSSAVYFLEENHEGLYKLTFGDGVLGKQLENGNVIRIKYLITDKDAANNAGTFTLADDIMGNSDATITTLQRAVGGSDREDIESIKFNAPLSFVSQNRAVTPDDYKAIILKNYANIDAISVWGGEDQDPPDYGKVFISIKPKDAEVLTESEKDIIIGQYLKPKNVVSITPYIVDPSYTYVYLEVFFKYNPNITDLSADALESVARESIRLYNDNELKRFDGVFRYSNILNQIDSAEVAILNTIVRVYMKKRFVPTLNVETKYEINFSSPFYKTSSDEQIVVSTAFTYNGKNCTLRDRLNTDGTRRIQVISGTGDNAQVVKDDIGYLEEATGKVVLEGFAPTAFVGDYIELTVSPNSNDLAPKRNELLNILVDDCEIVGEIDTMITGGTSAGVDYTTTARHR